MEKTDKTSQKYLTIFAALLLGASCMWNSFVSSLWMLFIGFFIPVVYFFLFDKPEELGLLPDNGDIDSVGKAGATSWENENESWTLKEAFHTKAFWGMLLCHILIPMITTGIVFHFISISCCSGFCNGLSFRKQRSRLAHSLRYYLRYVRQL